MENKDTNLNIRVSKTTKAKINDLAKEYNMKLSDFVLSMVQHVEKTRPVFKTKPTRRPQPAAAGEENNL